MKIEIIKNQVEDGEDYTKEVTVEQKEPRRGVRPVSNTEFVSMDVTDLDIIESYLHDKLVGRITITYKPEAAETINGVDIFYSPELDWEGQLEFTVYGEDSCLDTINLGYIDNQSLLQALATMDGATSINVH
jgi:hypothetical protein